MNSFKNNFQQRTVGPLVHDSTNRIIEGLVTKADRENNCCTIILADREGQEVEDVPVMLHDNGTTWFPKACKINNKSTNKEKKSIDSYVAVQESNNGYIIIGRWPGINYPEIRSAQELTNDKHPDSGGCPPGASCY